jgi:hypothetical protein
MDPATIREDARRTSTENLLDRVTIYREEMENAAIGIIESELRQRGISDAEIAAHAAMREQGGLIRRRDGTVVRCSFCPRPATARRRGWYRLWGWFLPLFPRLLNLCNEHGEQLPTDPHGRTLHYDVEQGQRQEDRAE